MNSPPSLNQYTVGWICPIVLELTAATCLLDVSMLDENNRTVNVYGDDAIYNVGKIGRHYVVVVGCSQMGTNQATAIVTNMRRSFPRIAHILIVGIAGGVPNYGIGSQEQIVLGDVVVSVPQLDQGGVTHYECGTWADGGDFEPRGHLLHSSRPLLQAVNHLRHRHSVFPGTKIPKFLEELRENLMPKERQESQDPGSKMDRLFEDNYPHQRKKEDCEGHCDLTRSILRESRGEQAFRKLDEPRIHYGTIGSANSFMASSSKRNELYNKHNIIAFEMEAAGVMSDNQGLVIRGVCDYCDSHTNKLWQKYAAATAAAYAKELILVLKHDEPLDPPTERVSSYEMILPGSQEHHRDSSTSNQSSDLVGLSPDPKRLDQSSSQVLHLCTSDEEGELVRDMPGIVELGNPKNSRLDIVFVHGLTGNRKTTWTRTRSGSEFFWPERLAADIPRVRVMSFGWTTNEPLQKGVESLEMHLSSKRHNDPTRPLIFVSHGVGILLCQLILLKNGTSRNIEPFLPLTSALIFFGSPVCDIAIAMSLTHASKYAQSCEEYERLFQQHLARLPEPVKILQCHPTHYQEELLLLEGAHIGANDSEKLEGDHSHMARFMEPRDAGYQLILRTVQGRLFI